MCEFVSLWVRVLCVWVCGFVVLCVFACLFVCRVFLCSCVFGFGCVWLCVIVCLWIWGSGFQGFRGSGFRA